MKVQTVLFLAAMMLWADRSYAYSHDGHYLVGAIADEMLAGTPTDHKVQALIGKVTLAQASILADSIKDWDPGQSKFKAKFRVTTNKALNSDLEAFLHANQTRPDCSGELLHHEYHFTDVQVSSTAPTYSSGQVGVNDHDVVHMVSFCIDVLSGKRSADNPQKITRRVALVLLVHYLGDLHQPLHVGAEYFDPQGKNVDPNHADHFAADKGGNALDVVMLSLADSHPTRMGNLHHYWDFTAVQTAMDDWANEIDPADPKSVGLNEVAEFLAGRLPVGWSVEPVIDPATIAVQCANEILPLAREAHEKLTFSGITERSTGPCPQVVAGTGTALPQDEYQAFAGKTVAEEIHKAGHRLADLLQAILK